MKKYIFLLIMRIIMLNAYAANQVTDTVLMISPDSFQYNVQTALTNKFQRSNDTNINITKQALFEFNNMVQLLLQHQINVITLKSRSDVATPDAVFPNNWFTTHELQNRKIMLVIYPLLTKNRILEKQILALKTVLNKNHIQIETVLDLSSYEDEAKALEGTGSLVLDRKNKIAFASLSPRTNAEILNIFAEKLGYKLVKFSSYDKNHQLIYHTNIMMNIGEHFAVVCEACIDDAEERQQVIANLNRINKKIIAISREQIEQMAGNILQVYSRDKKSKIILSQTAYEAFNKEQRDSLMNYGELVVVKIPTIEKIGGGSARCMLAEIFY